MATLKDLFTYPSESPTNFTNETYFAAVFDAGYFVSGNKYQIKFVGTTDFTAIGASGNTVGLIFTATGAGSGTGTAYDIASGLLGKFQNLKDETYKAIPGSLSVSTRDQLMQGASRFINYFENVKDTANKLNVFDFYSHPILQGNLRTINAQNIASATSSAGETTLTFGSAHGFLANDQVLCTGFNGAMAQLNGQVMFVVLVDATNLKLSFTSGGGDIYDPDTQTAEITLDMQHVNHYYTSAHSGAQSTIIDKTVTLDLANWAGTETITALDDGTGVLINDVDTNGTDLESQTLYAKSIGGTLYELFEDSALTNPKKSSEITTFNVDSIVGHAVVNVPQPVSGLGQTQFKSVSAGTIGSGFVQHDPRTYFNKGEPFIIQEIGTTDFTAVGASANTVGTTFISTTDSYSGTGKVSSARAHVLRQIPAGIATNRDNEPVSSMDSYFWNLKTTTTLSSKQQFLRAQIGDQAVNLNYEYINYGSTPNPSNSIAIQSPTAISTNTAADHFLRTKQIADKNYNLLFEAGGGWDIQNLFNKYTHLTKDSDGNVTMCLLSDYYDTYRTVVEGTVPYPYKMLPDVKFTMPKRLWHNVKFFDGASFSTTSSRTMAGLSVPAKGTIGNQGGKPVLDPMDVYCKVSGGYVWIAGNQAFDSSVNNATKIFGMPDDYKGQVVLWDPAATIENFRTDASEYNNLNIMSKTSSTYDVNQFTVQANDTTVGDGSKPALVTHITADTSQHPVTKPDGTEYYASITLAALNHWLGTSYVNGNTFTIALSPCPYTDITHGATGYLNPGVGHFFSDNASPSQTNALPAGLDSLYPYEVNETIGNNPTHQFTYQHSGLAEFTSYYAPGLTTVKTQPTLFSLANDVTLQSQDFGSVNVSFLFEGLSVATAGNLAPNGDKIYELDTVTIVNPGSQVYSYLNSSGATAYGLEIDANYYASGGTSARVYTSTGETKPTVALTADGSGYWSGATLDTSARGRFSTSATSGEPILLPIKALADAYTARTTTLVEQEETFDTEDKWISPAFNVDKEWPTNVYPQSAKITVNQPSTTNISQNGTKFVRSSGITRWQIEATYPPLTKAEFDKFHKVALAVQGQNIPFYFVIDRDNKKLFFNSGVTASTNQPVIIQEHNKSLFTIGGFDAHENSVFNEGEIIIFPSNSNGSLATIVNPANSNVFGETKIRLTHPNDTNFDLLGQKLYKDPFHVIVTLAEDNFEYTISTENYYYMTVKFDLDHWK